MAHPPRARGLCRSVKELPARTPLRIKLIAAVLALVTAALAVISIAGIAFLRSYLLGQADDQLRAAALYSNANTTVYAHLFFGAPAAQPGNGGLSIQWLPERGPLQQVVAEYSGYRDGQPHLVPGPEIKRSDSWLQTPTSSDSHASSWLNTGRSPVSAPVTVSAASGDGRWRVISTFNVFNSPNPLGQAAKGTIILGVDVTRIYQTLDELTAIDIIVS